MARVLINHCRNIAIECSRKDKWTVLVVGWAPVHRIKALNSEVDREWRAYDYELDLAIDKMINSWIENSAKKELLNLRGSKDGRTEST
jgi:hypothetical protein